MVKLLNLKNTRKYLIYWWYNIILNNNIIFRNETNCEIISSFILQQVREELNDPLLPKMIPWLNKNLIVTKSACEHFSKILFKIGSEVTFILQKRKIKFIYH